MSLANSAAVVNAALQLVGGYDNKGPLSGTPPTFDGSTEGLAAGAIYYEVVQFIARQYGFDFARQVASLVLTNNATGQFGFAYEYLYPTNAVQLLNLVPVTFSGLDLNNPTPAQWVVGNQFAGTAFATGYISWASDLQPQVGDTFTLNSRVFTYVTSGGTESNYDFNTNGSTQIGGLLVGQIVPYLTSSPTYLADADLNVANYSYSPSVTPTELVVTYKVPTSSGNGYPLAASAATVSGPTLTGGASGQVRVIWTNMASAQAVVSVPPPEAAWDSAFTEAVIQDLAAKLNLALAGKPESATLAAEQFGVIEKAAEGRTDT